MLTCVVLFWFARCKTKRNKNKKKSKGCFCAQNKACGQSAAFRLPALPGQQEPSPALLSQAAPSLPPHPPSPALQALGFCPIICSRTCDDLGRRWPARMNEGLWQSGMNSSSIFTTAEVVCDRRLPTGQLLSVKMALVIHELCSIRVRVGGAAVWEFTSS